MRSCITISAVASLLLAAGGPNPGPENAQPVPGWSFATEGSGIPRNQDAAGFAVEVDREVAHGGHASVSIRSIVAETHFRAVTQLIKADPYRGKRVRLAGYLKTSDVRGGWAGLWLRVDGPDAKLLAIDNMAAQRVMGTTDWSRHAVVLDVPEATVRLAYGALLHGTGQVWADDKTKGLADPAYLWLRSDSDTGMRFVSTKGRGPKGTTDWGPQEVVLDMSADAGGLSFGVVKPGAGTLRVDDASLEVVDPAKVPATEGVTIRSLDPVKRARELKESLPSTPDRPENLDFERQQVGPAAGAGGRAGDRRPDRAAYQRAQTCRRTETNAIPGSGMARHDTA
jgi:hypothetical protein